MARFVVLGMVILLVLSGGRSRAQVQDSTRDTRETWYEEAWTPIVTKNGVQFDYVFYRKADNQNNGVVIRLRNVNQVAVRYAFTIIFRGPAGTTTAQAEGSLQPGEMKTGEPDGLFWVPFRDGRRVAEIGLRNIEIALEPNHSASPKSRG